FRILMPAFPAYLLLAAAIVLLVPGIRTRPASRPFSLTGRRLTAAVAIAFAIVAALPLGVIAAIPPLHDHGRLAVRVGGSLIPVSTAIRVRATAQGNNVRLSWHGRPAGPASGFYRVFRAGDPEGGLFCAGRLRNAADNCALAMESPGTTRTPTLVDHPGRGTWTYRIGVVANWLNDERYGDVYVVSPPVTATVT